MERECIEVDFPYSFQAIDWVECDIIPDEDLNDSNQDKFEYAKLKYTIFCSGCDESGNSVSLRIKNYCPEFYVKMPANAISFKNYVISKCNINKKLSNFNVYKKEFYGYTGNKLYRFAKLAFDNLNSYRQAVKILKPKYSLYQSNLDNFIKFIHFKNLRPSGWLTVNNGENVEEFSSCSVNIECDFDEINYLEKDSNAKFLQASFDIETYTKNGGRPDVSNKDDPIIQIGTSFKYVTDTHFSLKHIVTLKTCATEKIKELNETSHTKVVVESYDTEKEVILAWAKLINRTDPDIIYHYNGDSYDWHFIYNKAKLYGNNFVKACLKLLNRLQVHTNSSSCNVCCNKVNPTRNQDSTDTRHFGCNLGAYYSTSSFSSSAYGTSHYKRISILGRLNFDIYIYIRREFKLRYYKLNFVSQHFLKNNKVDLDYKDMFKCFEVGTPEEIEKIAIYCIQDTVLPQELVDKLNILYHQICMANVTYVPIKFLIEKGQQIKVFSQIIKLANQCGYLVPAVLNNENEEDDSFEGATVFKPEVGTYFQPITVCDFSSLYPSIIRSNNLCYTTYISDYTPQKYPNIPVLEVNISDSSNHYFAKDSESILPNLLSELAKSRKEYKNKMEKEEDAFQKEIYNKMQLAYKVSMNSVYGFLGAQKLKCKPIAESVTCLGRNMIKDSKDYIEENYPLSKIIYGDSIPKDEVVLVKHKKTGLVEYKYIEELGDKNWIDYPGFKLFDEEIRIEKQYSLESEYLVYSSDKWTEIKKIIRHKTNKELFTVATKNGIVSVTSDHSLLDKNKNIVKPTECKIGETELLTKLDIADDYTNNQIFDTDPIFLFLYGLFLTNGSFDRRQGKLLFTDIIYKYSTPVIERIKKKFSNNCSIISEIKNGFYVDYTINLDECGESYINFIKDLFLNHQTEIFNLNPKHLTFIYNGISYSNPLASQTIIFNKKDKKGLANMYLLLKKLGKNYLISQTNTEVIQLIPSRKSNTSKSIVSYITSYQKEYLEDYVYDIETECGNFNAGIGEIICKNTDSVFVKFNTKSIQKLIEMQNSIKNKKLDKKEFDEYQKIKEICRKESMEMGKEASKNVTKALFKPPVSLEFEKVFDPFVLVTKKRYFGGYYSKSYQHYDKKHCTGLLPNRKDSIPFVVDVYNKAIDLFVDKGEQGLYEFIDYLKEIIENIKENKVDDYEKFTIVKTLNDSYKTGTIDDKKFIITEINKAKDKLIIKGPSSLHLSALEGNFYINIQGTKYKTKQFTVEDNRIVMRLETPIKETIKNEEAKNKDKIRKTVLNSEQVSLEGTIKLPNSPHVVLARKLKERNPLNPPQSNDKIPYVFIEIESDKTEQLYKKVEDPEYAKRHNLPLDANYYIKAIRIPIGQILDLVDPNLTIQVFGE